MQKKIFLAIQKSFDLLFTVIYLFSKKYKWIRTDITLQQVLRHNRIIMYSTPFQLEIISNWTTGIFLMETWNAITLIVFRLHDHDLK